MNQEKIGKFIAQCRKNKNMTQEQLAERLGVTNRSVSRWENGKNMPDYSILKELCNILEIDVNEFLCGEGIEKNKVEVYSIENLDLVLKEYYKMKKNKDKLKKIIIIGGSCLISIFLMILTIFVVCFNYRNRVDIITNTSKYQEVIGSNAKDIYKYKLGMSEEIFPKSIDKLNVKEFKMICENFFDQQFLSYLVVEYDEDEYKKEIKRLNKYGIEDYNGYYSVTGFTDYKLVAMESDYYHGFVYALTDGKNKIIYVELIFCNYFMSIDYEHEILEEYLPDGFNAKVDNPYKEKMMIEKI